VNHDLTVPLRKIFLFGYYGRRNIGDDAVCISMVETIEKLLKSNALLYVYAKEKYLARNFRRENDSNVYFTSSLAENFRAIMNSQTIAIGGGDYLDDYGHIFRRIQIFAQLFAFGIFAKISAKKFLIINGGFRATTRMGLTFIKIISFFARCVSAKDNDSQSLLSKYVKEQPEKGFDTAILLDYGSVCQSKVDPKVINVGFSITPVFSNFFLQDSRDDVLVNAIVKTIEIVSHYSKKVNFYFLALNTDNRFGDLRLIRKIMLMLNEDSLERTELIAYTGDVGDFISKYSQLDAIVCCKLHSVVFSYALKKPMIVLNYHPKNAGLAREIGLPRRCVLSLEELINGNLSPMLSNLLNNPEEYRDKLSISEAKERAINGIQKCLDCLK
jgi:polysaccharide pyruvyl transferase WcaK-like protein